MIYHPDIKRLITFTGSTASLEIKYRGTVTSGMLCWLESAMIKDWWKATEARVEPEQGGIFYLNWTEEPGKDHVVYGVVQQVDPEYGTIRVGKILYIFPEGRLSNLDLEIGFRQIRDSKSSLRVTLHHGFDGAARAQCENHVLRAWPRSFALFLAYIEQQMLHA